MGKKIILSIDGGGVKGVIPICLLVKLESETGKLSRDIFSFIAGTSTGAVIAAALSAGIPAKELLNSYKNLSDQLFERNFFSKIKRFFWGYYYSTEKLNRLIKEQLGDAENWRINNSPVDLLITAKRVIDGKPWYFVKDDPKNSGRTGNLSLADCVTASSAAPTYFYPWTITEDNLQPGWEPVGTLTDGGVGIAGNPVYQACVEAFYYTNRYSAQDSIIVSLGTGRFMTKAMPTWLPSWLNWVLGELLQSTGEQQTELTQRHFSKADFYRLDPDLKILSPNLKEEIALDDSSSLPRLIRLGEKFAAKVEWESILEGKDNDFKVSSSKTSWTKYKWP